MTADTPAGTPAPRRGPGLRSLRNQLVALLVFALTAAIVGMGWQTARQEANQALEGELQRARNYMNYLVAVGLQSLLLSDIAALEEQLLNIAANPHVLEIEVSERGGRTAGHVVNADGKGPRLAFTPSRLVPPNDERDRVYTQESEAVLWQPIDSAGTIGWVRLRYDLSEVTQRRADILRNTLVIMGLAGALGATLLLGYLRRPLRALNRAQEFALKLGARHGEQLDLGPAPIEIEQLQHALNQASTSLQQQDRQLATSTQALRDSEQRLHDMVQQAPDAIVMLDLDGRLISANRAAEELVGRSGDELVGRHFTEIGILTDNAADAARAEFRQIVDGRTRTRLELPIRRPNGRLTITEVRPRLIRRHGHAAEIQLILRDITDRKQNEEMVARFGRVLDASSNEIYIFDADTLRFVQVNAGAQKNLGYNMDELSVLTPVDIKPEYGRAEFEALLAPLRDDETDVLDFETVHRRRDGSTYPVEVHLQLSRTEHPPVFLAVVQDIALRRQIEQNLQFLANFDTLTGLANRTQLAEQMDRVLNEASRHQRLAGVMFLDLDNFKMINDSLGHGAGDALLRAVADGLRESVRPGDTVARLGGDEFVVVLANVGHLDDIARVADKILERLGQPVTLDGRELVVTPSIGISVYPLDNSRGEDLLKNADIAMYHAKERGRNNYQFFTADLDTRVKRRMAVESSLRHAIQHGGLSLAFQPQVDVISGRTVGVEALARWQHPEWGAVSPAEFIPVAEETGLILPLGEWVLREACRHAKAWHDAGQAIRVSVNLSTRQFDDTHLVDTISRALAGSGLQPEHLDLEITESLLMKNLDASASVLNVLTDLGITLSLDDFGTGYSSLAYLKRLPIDVLKIDRAFVSDLDSKPDDAAIAHTIIVLAKSLGMRVTAEGVETADQFEFLRRYGCDVVQGYYLGKPMGDPDLRIWLGRDTLTTATGRRHWG